MFDMLLESGHRPSLLPSWGKGVALTLHVVVLAALWHRPAAKATEIPIVFDTVSYQPAPPAGDGFLRPIPPIGFEPGPIELPAPPEFSIPKGKLSPAPLTAGEGTMPRIETSLIGSADSVYVPSLVQQAPELLTAPTPVYPPLLRAAGIQGRVMVALIVDTLGQAENGSVRIVLSDNPGFDAAALATVRAARFRPARIYGRAVRVLVQVPVVFRLD